MYYSSFSDTGLSSSIFKHTFNLSITFFPFAISLFKLFTSVSISSSDNIIESVSIPCFSFNSANFVNSLIFFFNTFFWSFAFDIYYSYSCNIPYTFSIIFHSLLFCYYFHFCIKSFRWFRFYFINFYFESVFH